MPPLARPTRPRQPWRRVAEARAGDRADPPAKPAEPEGEQRGEAPGAEEHGHDHGDAVPTHAGDCRRWRSSSPAPCATGRTGATAMRNSRASPMGMVMRSK